MVHLHHNGLQEVEAFQGWGEKCWRLKEGVPTGAGPDRYTGLADMLVVKLGCAVDEDIELSMGCIPVIQSEYKKDWPQSQNKARTWAIMHVI